MVKGLIIMTKHQTKIVIVILGMLKTMTLVKSKAAQVEYKDKKIVLFY